MCAYQCLKVMEIYVCVLMCKSHGIEYVYTWVGDCRL